VLILVGVVLLFGGMLSVGITDDGAVPTEVAGLLIVAMVIVVIGSLLSLASLIMFIIHMSKNPLVPEDQRILWIVGIILFNGIVNIVYFFMYITREEELEAQRTAPSPQTKNQWD
jgi:hypothetical protein